MISQNPVFQVLVVNNNIAALAAGNPVSALAIGQIGFFSYETNLSIDGTVPSANRSFYIAVGVDPNGTGSLADVTKSAGNSIQLGGIRAFTAKPYQAAQNKQIQLKIGAVTCNTEYGVRFEIRSDALSHIYGYNFPYKSFSAFTAPCADQCVDCASGDPNSLVASLSNNINLDTDGVLVATLTSPLTNNTIPNLAQWELGFNALATPSAPSGTPTTGTGSAAANTYFGKVTAVNADGESLPSAESTGVVLSATGEIAWTWPAVTGAVTYNLYVGIATGAETSVFTGIGTNSYTQIATAGTAKTPPVAGVANTPNPNSGLTAQMVISVLPDKLTNYSQINLKYADPRQLNMYMSLLTDPNTPNGWGSFGPDTVQSDLTALVYEDGSGYDIQQLEYIAGGWNGNPGPYRTSELVGVPTHNIQYYSTISGQYMLYSITNDNSGIGGTAVNRSSMATYIALPTASTTAIASVNAILHRIIDQASGNDSTVNTAYPYTQSYNTGVLANS